MNNNEIIERIKVLYLSLQFCSEQIKVFTSGERICINQERLQWMHILTNTDAKPRPVSIEIESKIKNITELISLHRYNFSFTDPLLDELLSINNLTNDTE